jgi:hypothetical protein
MSDHITMMPVRAFLSYGIPYIFRGDSEMVDYNNLYMLIFTPIRSSINPTDSHRHKICCPIPPVCCPNAIGSDSPAQYHS